MTTPTDILDGIVATLTSSVDMLDCASIDNYLPAIRSDKVGLIAVGTGHETEITAATMTLVQYAHRMRLQLWVKLVQGGEAAANDTARDIGYLCMRSLIEHDGDGYALALEDGRGAIMSYEVDQQVVSAGGQAYIIGTLTVPVWQIEEVG